MKTTLLLLPLLALVVFPMWADKPFFYDKTGEKIIYSVRKDKVLLKYNSTNDARSLQSNVVAKELTLLPENRMIADVDTTQAQLRAIRETPGISDAGYMLQYREGDGQLIYPTEKLFICHKEGESIDRILEIAGLSEKVLSIERFTEYSPLYIVQLDEPIENMMDIGNRTYETGLCEFAVPSFMRIPEFLEPIVSQNMAQSTTIVANTTDYYPMQWGLKNTAQFQIDRMIAGCDIDVEPAWEITKGNSSIKIAVVDNGVQLDHPELVDNLLQGYNGISDYMGQGAGAPYDKDDTAHGTNCAGVIAAVDNGVGVIGVAPNCKIIPIKAYSEFVGYDATYANGLRYAWKTGKADVVCCSWFIAPNALNPAVELAIDCLVVHGRNGKGSVVVCAAGNNAEYQVLFPASHPATIAVGAISPCGERKTPTSCCVGSGGFGVSAYGEGLDVVAPGINIYTTGLGGNIETNFMDTSAACPFVAGIAALVLSVDPSLTYEEVRTIIRSTAVDPITQQPYSVLSEEFGYGLAKAGAAVSLAASQLTYIVDRTVTADTVVSNRCVFVQNATVTNNAKLTIDAQQYVEINGPFEVELGSELELR